MYLPLSLPLTHSRTHKYNRVTTHILQLRIKHTQIRNKNTCVCVFCCLPFLPCAVSAFWPTCLRGSPACEGRSQISIFVYTFFFVLNVFLFYFTLRSGATSLRNGPAIGIAPAGPRSRSRFQSQSRSRSGFYLLYSILLLFSFRFWAKYTKCVSQTEAHTQKFKKETYKLTTKRGRLLKRKQITNNTTATK